MLPELSTLLKFEHEKVMRAYVRTRGGTESKAKELFYDMLLYLWLSNKHQQDREANPTEPALDFVFVMHEEMREIDEMWHNFILYTRDYTDFCASYFKTYLHHVPDVAETLIQTDDEFAVEMAKYLSYVFDNLGEVVVRRWFARHFAPAPEILHSEAIV